MKQKSQTTENWVSEEEIIISPALKIIRKSDSWDGMSKEEVEDRKEFIRCYLLKDHEIILLIPMEPQENDFWAQTNRTFWKAPSTPGTTRESEGLSKNMHGEEEKYWNNLTPKGKFTKALLTRQQ